MEINLKEIGYVHNQVEEKKHHSWGNEISTIRLNKEYSGGFLGLEQFSHVTLCFILIKRSMIVTSIFNDVLAVVKICHFLESLHKEEKIDLIK